MGILFAAKFYMVTMLEELARDYIQKNLSHQTIFTFYNQAIQMKDDPAIEACFVWIDNNAKEFFGADNFNKLDKSLVCSLLTRDSLMIQETDVFKAVINWGKFQCQSAVNDKLRNALCDILPLIRFPLMKREDFWNLEELGVLKKQDILDINHYFRGGPKPSFSIIPRNMPVIRDSNVSFVEMPNGKMIVQRFKIISKDEFVFPRNKWSGVAFRVDRDIEILGFGIYGAKRGFGTYSGQISFSDYENKRFEGNELICKVTFTNPGKVYKNYRYFAQVKFSGPPSYCGEQGQGKIVCHTSNGPVTFTFEDYKRYGYDLKVLTGQAPEIIFRLVK